MEKETKKNLGRRKNWRRTQKKDDEVIYAYMSKEAVEKLKTLAKLLQLTPIEYIEKHLISK